MHRISRVLFIGSLLLPSAVFADSIELHADIDAWKSIHQEESLQQGYIEAEMLREQEAELFPEEQIASGSILDQMRDERVSTYVSVVINGKLVVFRDVLRTAWYAPYVRDIAEQGIVSGYQTAQGIPTGDFGPGDNVTVEQMAKVMMLASGKFDDDCPKTPKNLTASGSWSASYVACAEKLQWSIFGDGTIDVKRPALRNEVIVTLLQAFEIQPGERTGIAFEDVTSSTQFGAFIERAKADNIISGYTDQAGRPTGFFGPQDKVTRAEFAKIVTLGMQMYRK